MKTSSALVPTGIHATAVIFREAGILIRGPSGSGKSSLAIVLMELARAQRCFGALVGDDRVLVWPRSGRLEARCGANIEGLIERRGIGIYRTDYAASAMIHVVVDLYPRGQELARTAGCEVRIAEIGGIALPHLTLGGAASRLEQAYAVTEELDRIGFGQARPIANFA